MARKTNSKGAKTKGSLSEEKAIHSPDEQSEIDLIENSNPIAIKQQQENWNEYILEDGATLKIKPIVVDVRKSLDVDTNGNAQYHIRSTIIIDVQPSPKKTSKP